MPHNPHSQEMSSRSWPPSEAGINAREYQLQLIERIRFLISRLNMTQGEFARRIGVDPTNFSKILNGRLRITRNLINRIAIDLGVSLKWLETGMSLPFDKPAPNDGASPVYDIDVCAGASELAREFTADRIIGSVKFPGLSRDSVIVRVSGNSMEPEIQPGSYIAIRPVTDTSCIAWGQIYVIVTDDLRLVKHVVRNPDPTLATLRSSNPDYDDMELPRNKIRGLYIVEAILNLKIHG